MVVHVEASKSGLVSRVRDRVSNLTCNSTARGPGGEPNIVWISFWQSLTWRPECMYKACIWVGCWQNSSIPGFSDFGGCRGVRKPEKEQSKIPAVQGRTSLACASEASWLETILRNYWCAPFTCIPNDMSMVVNNVRFIQFLFWNSRLELDLQFNSTRIGAGGEPNILNILLPFDMAFDRIVSRFFWFWRLPGVRKPEKEQSKIPAVQGLVSVCSLHYLGGNHFAKLLMHALYMHSGRHVNGCQLAVNKIFNVRLPSLIDPLRMI